MMICKCHSCEHMNTCEWSFTNQMNYCKGEKMGKKFVIELEDKVSENAKGEPLYFVKGFNNLSLDETALKKLTPYEDYEEPKHEFKVGDAVELDGKTGIIVGFEEPQAVCVLLKDGRISWGYIKDLKYLDKSFSKSLRYLLEDLV